LANLTKEITELEREDVEQVASQLIHKYMHYVHVALQGTTLFSTEEYGLTLEEEKAQSGMFLICLCTYNSKVSQSGLIMSMIGRLETHNINCMEEHNWRDYLLNLKLLPTAWNFHR